MPIPWRFILALYLIAIVCLVVVANGRAHSPIGKPISSMTLTQQYHFLYQAAKHHRYVSRHGRGYARWWHRKALAWTMPNLRRVERQLWWSSARNRNIAAAEAIARRGGNPWPNCPDPYHDGGSWDDTKACESRGYSWAVDPPGHFCGPLQIDPDWWGSIIRRYGVPC